MFDFFFFWCVQKDWWVGFIVSFPWLFLLCLWLSAIKERPVAQLLTSRVIIERERMVV